MIVNFVQQPDGVHTSSMPLLLSTPQRQNDLRDQIHREFVNRPFQFNKRSQLFIRVHDETLSVAVSVSNERSVKRL